MGAHAFSTVGGLCLALLSTWGIESAICMSTHLSVQGLPGLNWTPVIVLVSTSLFVMRDDYTTALGVWPLSTLC